MAMAKRPADASPSLSPVKAAVAAATTIAKKAKTALFGGNKITGVVTQPELLRVPTGLLSATLDGLVAQ